MSEEFEKIQTIPQLNNRIEYLEAFQKNKTTDKPGFINALILFSLFVEHISLFGQFLILMSFNKERNLFKGLSNIVEATSKEEEIHGKFGIALYEIIKKEMPEIFTDEFMDDLVKLTHKAQQAELGIIDWIYENGDLEFISKETVKNYINNRFNNSLLILGNTENLFDIDVELINKTKWFDMEVLSTKETDFFYKREISYSKKQKDFDPESLF